MGQVRHGSATTTHAVRAAIQRSQASLATLSRELGISHIHARNAGVAPDTLDRLVDEELGAARPSFWSTGLAAGDSGGCGE